MIRITRIYLYWGLEGLDTTVSAHHQGSRSREGRQSEGVGIGWPMSGAVACVWGKW